MLLFLHSLSSSSFLRCLKLLACCYAPLCHLCIKLLERLKNVRVALHFWNCAATTCRGCEDRLQDPERSCTCEEESEEKDSHANTILLRMACFLILEADKPL